MFKKKENGFSLVELAVAAAIATALAVVAVTVVTGTATSVSEKGSSAAAAESCTISESLKGGTDETINDCGTATATNSGSQNTVSTEVTITLSDFVAVNNNWFGSQSGSMWAVLDLPVGTQSVSNWNELYDSSATVPYKTLQFMGISQEKADAILSAFANGATKVTTGGKDYYPVTRKSVDYADRATQSGPGTIYDDIIRHYGPANDGGWRLELWVDTTVSVSYHNPPLDITVN